MAFRRCLQSVLQQSNNGVRYDLNLGLDREGIYRVSGKVIESNELRIALETDMTNIDFMDEKVDIHLVTGMVKQYFRELPDQILNFPPKDRAEYSSISFVNKGIPSVDERVSKLKSRVQGLPAIKQTVLLALLTHLKMLIWI